ncbi:MAG: CHASE2 domain-containing protein [Giesbergeria sp.]
MGLFLSPFFRGLGEYEFDLLTSLTAPAPVDAGVLVVGLDEVSLARLGLAPPLPRHFHADLIRALTEGGAAALAVDMLFAEPQTAVDDGALEQALQGPLPVVLAGATVRNESSQVAHYSQQLPSIFPQATRGDIAVPLDADGVSRRAPAQPGALWRVLAHQAGRPVAKLPEGALLRYYAPEVPMPYAHYTQALDAKHQLPPGALHARLVLLGQNTPVGGVDQFRTPFAVLGGGMQSGVFLHATALQNGLLGDWIRPVAWPLGWLVAVLAMGAGAAFTRRWNALGALAVHGALGGLGVLAAVAAFVAGWWLSVVPLLVGLAVHWNLGAAHSYLRERTRRQRLRADFARYVPPAVVDALVASDASSYVHGERRTLTLLFCDLADFTAASEALAPEAVARTLNQYFTHMAHCVLSHGGTLDKFIGDAVMAFWNAPLPDAKHAARAVACAQAMQREMDVLRTDWRGTPFAEVGLRIGVHTGEAAVGHMGSTERFTYTAVGDAVNTAARLEAANKALGTNVLLSEATVQAVPVGAWQGSMPLWLDCVMLAGRSSGIDVYTLCDDTALPALGEALRRHIHAGRLRDALEVCKVWRSHAAQCAPLWAASAEVLSERLQAVLEEADSKGQAEPITLPPRQLAK